MTFLKRLIVWLLCFCLLCIPVRAAEHQKLVALTFDDGPSGKYTRRLLAGLEERKVKATFFLCGYRMEQYPELTEQIFEQGHEIGLHGYSHKSMKNMCRAEVAEELEKTMALIPEHCVVAFLRTPGGISRESVQTVAADMGLAVLSWSVDPKDWATHDAQKVEQEVITHVQDGDVILLHDMSDSSVDAALVIIDELQKQGFQFVTVSELTRQRQIPVIPGKEYSRFEPSDSEGDTLPEGA